MMNKILTFVAFCTILFLPSCTHDDDQFVEDKEFVECGLVLEFEGVPLESGFKVPSLQVDANAVGAQGSDIYAVQIYSKSTLEGNFDYFAYGLYDDLTKLKIKLIKGDYYKVVMTCLINGKNTLSSNATGNYGKPFEIQGSSSGARLSNELTISSSKYFKSLSCGEALLKGTIKSTLRPVGDRYYGQSEIFLCESQMDFKVDLKRVVFALEVSAEELTTGRAQVILEGASEVVLNAGEKETIVYTLAGGASDVWMTDDYTETMFLTLLVDPGNGVFTPVAAPKEVVFKRNYKYPLSVKGDKSSGANVSFEEKEFATAPPIEF